MSLSGFVRNRIRKLVTGQSETILTGNTPPVETVEEKFQNITELGLYLHIPFCRQICPYCPYNKEIYDPLKAKEYTEAVKHEIDLYAGIIGARRITSFYIGGGTPTTMLFSGLAEILEYVYKKFNMQCDIHMESHPNDLTEDNLRLIKSLRVKYLSVGVEALQDRHLQFLRRPYDAVKVKKVIEKLADKDFACVNVDFIFALPDQTYKEVQTAAQELVNLGVSQVAAYPLFYFPYTQLGQTVPQNNYNPFQILRRRKMLGILESVFYSAGYRRTSVWAFTRKGFPKICSVTIPLYLGLGASGGSSLKDIFYLNTFNVREYIRKLEAGKMPIALSLDLTERMQMAWWLYWRIYETGFRKSDFKKRFGKRFEDIYGRYFKLFSLAGFIMKDNGDEVILSDRGIFWLHTLEDLFSLDYIGKLWGTSMKDPWPEKVSL